MTNLSTDNSWNYGESIIAERVVNRKRNEKNGENTENEEDTTQL